MKIYRYILINYLSVCSVLAAGEFTVASYNCGGLPDHYDYLRAAAMQKLMQERYSEEPEQMVINEKIQQLAMKILFSEEASAQQEWDRQQLGEATEQLTLVPADMNSPNRIWNQKAEAVITDYKTRPVVFYDDELYGLIRQHVVDLAKDEEGDIFSLLGEVRRKMAKRIFAYHLKYDLICLQEADYLDASMFPDSHEVLFAKTVHSVNGVAWNKERFALIEPIDSKMERAFVVKLLDKHEGKIVWVASGHLTGCNPYHVVKDPATGNSDALKGDGELQKIVDLLEECEAGLMLIGMDSNVTSLHPRLAILKEAGYQIDDENYLEPTCTNPYLILNTRIDWIALKAIGMDASIVNIPVLGVGLNSIQTNISDHKPIAAKIRY